MGIDGSKPVRLLVGRRIISELHVYSVQPAPTKRYPNRDIIHSWGVAPWGSKQFFSHYSTGQEVGNKTGPRIENFYRAPLDDIGLRD